MSPPAIDKQRNAADEGAAPRPAAQPWLAAAGVLIIAGLALVAYWPCLNGGFVWDDDNLLVNNKLVHASDGLYRMWFTNEPVDYWPLTYTSFWIEWRLWGANPLGYHLTNLALHVTSCLLLWVILRKLSIPGAFLAALLFAVHPVNVESVAWIAQRKNTLAMCFFLLSILWYLQEEVARDEGREAREKRRLGTWYWLSLMAFLLAMLAKGSVAILPVVLLGIDWWQRRRITGRDLLRSVPFFLIAVLLTGVNIWFQTHGTDEVIRHASFAERMVGAGAAVWFYLGKAIAPLDLMFVYPQWQIDTGDLRWWLPLLAAAALTAALGWYAPRATWVRAVFFAWGFFCVALAPVLGFADVYFMKYSLVADHYQYIALIGIVALVAAGCGVLQQHASEVMRFFVLAVVVLAVGALTAVARQQCEMYRDIVTLYRTTIDKNPECWMAHNNLGLELVKTGQNQSAIEHYRQALKIRPDYPEAHNNLAMVLGEIGEQQEAEEHLRQAIALNRRYPDARINLGIALVREGKTQEAIAQFEDALRLNPSSAFAHNDLGQALFETGRTTEAIPHFQIALRLMPEYAVAQLNLANALRADHQFEEAVQHYRAFLQLQPNDAATYAELTKNYAAMQRPAEAIATAQQALNLARSQNDTELAERIADWLQQYQAALGKQPASPPSAGEDRSSPKPAE